MAVDVTSGDPFQVGRPAPLIDSWTRGTATVLGYDVHPDGSFVIARRVDNRSRSEKFGATEFHVVLYWFEELKRRMPN